MLLWIIVIGAGVVLYHDVYVPRARREAANRMPSDLRQPRVITGGDWLGKTNAFTDARLGWITSIAVFAPPRANGNTMVIAGNEGAAILDEAGAPRHQVTFEGCASQMNVVTLSTGGPIWYFNDGSGTCAASLLDPDGKPVWHYEGRFVEPELTVAVAGDLDGDGSVAIVLGFARDGGIQRLNASGEKVWEQPEKDVWYLEIAELAGHPRPVIVYANGAGELVIRDHRTGRLVREPEKMVPYLSQFSLTRWPGRSGSVHVLKISAQKLLLQDLNGNLAWQREAPLAVSKLWPLGTSVRLKAGQPAHFAVLALWIPWRRSVLWIYDASGNLVYQEVLPVACAAIQALPDSGGAADALLLGCRGTVWQYRPVK